MCPGWCQSWIHSLVRAGIFPRRCSTAESCLLPRLVMMLMFSAAVPLAKLAKKTLLTKLAGDLPRFGTFFRNCFCRLRSVKAPLYVSCRNVYMLYVAPSLTAFYRGIILWYLGKTR